MALTRPRGFEGQVRGVSHHGQETHLHKQAGYIDADFLHPSTFPLHSDGGPYIAVKSPPRGADGGIVTEMQTLQAPREPLPTWPLSLSHAQRLSGEILPKAKP